MPRHTRRFTLARLAIFAWLAFVVVASVVPFLFSIAFWERDDHGVWFTTGGMVGRWSIHKRHGAQAGTDTNSFDWHPSSRSWARFDFMWRDPTGGMISQEKPVMIGAPPWIVLIAPTLVVLGTSRAIGFRARRRLTKLGRTPCPTCNYDTTDLTTCPECGTTIDPVTEIQT